MEIFIHDILYSSNKLNRPIIIIKMVNWNSLGYMRYV